MSTHNQPHDHSQEAVYAARMEDAVKVVLRENILTEADRAVLEHAVFIARNMRKKPGKGE
jgi:hypothetical protein